MLKHSQNFIQKEGLIQKLIEKTNITSEDIVLEIGTGSGNITAVLSNHARLVISIEKDEELFTKTKYTLKNRQNVKLVLNDFMQVALPRKAYTVFANIPFNFTADILRKLLFSRNAPKNAYLFVQREAAFRFMGTPLETRMSLLLKSRFAFKILHKCKRSDFKPKPQVDIVFLSIQKRSPPLLSKKDYTLYRNFIIYAFRRSKKDIRRTLKEILTYIQLKRLSRALGFDLNSNLTRLSFSQWLGLFSFIKDKVPEEKLQILTIK